jgi:hypothetical protein
MHHYEGYECDFDLNKENALSIKSLYLVYKYSERGGYGGTYKETTVPTCPPRTAEG